MELVGVILGKGLVLLVIGQQRHNCVVILDEKVNRGAIFVALFDLNDDIIEGCEQSSGGDIELIKYKFIGNLLMFLYSRFVEQVSVHHILRILVVVGLVIAGQVRESSLELCRSGLVIVKIVVEIAVSIVGVTREQLVGVGA